MSRFSRAEKFELTAIFVAAVLTFFARRGQNFSSELGPVIAGGALILLLQGFVRDLWRLREARRNPAPSPARAARCMCVESAVGLATVLAGVALTLTGLGRPVMLSAAAMASWAGGIMIAGFCLKDFVFEWFPWKLYREKDHAGLAFTWRR